MKLFGGKYFSVFLLLLTITPGFAEVNNVLIREDFNDLENWKLLEFPKIKRHTKYSIEKEENGSYLKAESNASASGIVFNKEFDVFKYPNARWRWKISNVYKKGNAEEKSGDDNPVRIIFNFKYDPEKASLSQRVKYGFVKTIYGEYPPHSSLKYIWESRKHDKKIYTNPYAPESKMIILQAGDEDAGSWLEQEVNIVKDYREAFGKDPPAIAGIAIMNDSDNTGESSVSYIDYIEIYK
ncbi:MAG: DUF3047 domain-containing protein [Nitrospirae bacterium]|nr:DUF3047 domain-containing protein [Nitrospirota bacterium]